MASSCKSSALCRRPCLGPGTGRRHSRIRCRHRGEARPAQTPRGLDYIGYVDAIQERLEVLLETEVGIVPEPARKQRLQEKIDKDRIVAF